MIWFLLSLTAALSVSVGDVVTKKYFSHLSAYEMGLIRLAYAVPLLAVIFFSVDWLRPPSVFWGILAVALPLEMLAFYLYMKAIKVSPLSLSIPFLAFTPMFVILTGSILLSERVSAGGLTGILLIVIGSYVLNISHIKKGWARPLVAILTEAGSRLMLIVSFIYAVTSTLGKLAILHSSPVFFGTLYNMILCLAFLSMLPFSKAPSLKKIVEKPWAGILLGAVVSISVISHMIAISKIEAAYMVSIKRTSILFSVLLGAWVFKEEKLKERLIGAALMLVGVILIALSA